MPEIGETVSPVGAHRGSTAIAYQDKVSTISPIKTRYLLENKPRTETHLKETRLLSLWN